MSGDKSRSGSGGDDRTEPGGDDRTELESAIADAERLGDELDRLTQVAQARAGFARRRIGWIGGAVVLLLVVVLALWMLVLRPGAGQAAGGCTPLRVMAATAIAPAVRQVAADLDGGSRCLRVQVDAVDGRAAGAKALATQADLWIPDDPAWVRTAPAELVDQAAASSPKVIATTPVVFLAGASATQQLTGSAAWGRLDDLIGAGKVRLVTPEPQSDGAGLIGIGGLGEVVWLERGMDASAAALRVVQERARVVPTAAQAVPARADELSLVTEHALLSASPPAGTSVLVPQDHTVLLRYSWVPTQRALADPRRAAAVRKLARAFRSSEGRAALAAAGLRTADAAPLPRGRGEQQLRAEALPALKPHHVDHVFTTWYPADRKVNLLIVVDVSGSMKEKPPGSDRSLITTVRQGVASVAQLLPNTSRLGLWEFGTQLDGERDYRQLVPPAALGPAQRAAMAKAVRGLTAQRTDTGLYDTVLAAYRAGLAGADPALPTQVMIFTDGINDGDPNSITVAQLARELAAAAASATGKPPVSLGVMAFGGNEAAAAELEGALKSVEGYVDRVASADEVDEAFLHLAAGGLHS